MKETILSLVSPEYPWADRFFWLEETDSTNDRLKALARQGAPHGTVLMADRQTGGHGRMGRSFFSPDGTGLYMSVLLRPEASVKESLFITGMTAVATASAIETVSNKRCGIKWVNDIFVEDAGEQI